MESPSRIRRFVSRYERHLSVLSMAAGFVADNLALRRADLLPETVLIYAYLALSAALILAVHLVEEGRWKEGTGAKPWLLIALQFVSGSMFSAFLVFYSRSASFSATWPFLLVLFAVFAGTEVFKRYQARLGYQCGIFFFGLLSFSVYEVPVAVGAIGTGVFLESGVAASVLFALFVLLLFAAGPRRFVAALPRVAGTAAGILILVNALYFARLLPPLPLALTDIGVYHSIVRTADGYAAAGEPIPWIDGLVGVAHVSVRPGDPVFVFSSVFAPIALRTEILHRWDRWDPARKQWVVNSVIGFPLVGGRSGGYRGFSEIDGIPAGAWRVSVETPDGRIIGRVVFDVAYVGEEPALSQGVL